MIYVFLTHYFHYSCKCYGLFYYILIDFYISFLFQWQSINPNVPYVNMDFLLEGVNTTINISYTTEEFWNTTGNDTNVTTIPKGSDQNESFYSFVHGMYMYAIPLISILGILGNIASFRVFMFTSFGRHPSCIYLAALSVSDTWFLIALLVGWMGSLDSLHIGSSAYCVISIYIAYVTSFLSVWYVVLIMIDRYIVVCHPLRGPSSLLQEKSHHSHVDYNSLRCSVLHPLLLQYGIHFNAQQQAQMRLSGRWHTPVDGHNVCRQLPHIYYPIPGSIHSQLLRHHIHPKISLQALQIPRTKILLT